MTWTRLSLCYLCGYLLAGGLTLLVFPLEGLRLLLSNGDYGEVMPRVVGMLMTGLGLVVVSIIATRTEPLYPVTLGVRTRRRGLRTRDEHLKRNRARRTKRDHVAAHAQLTNTCVRQRSRMLASVTDLSCRSSCLRPGNGRPPAISGGPFPFLNSRATRGTAVPVISISCREENKQP
jgi:hypothetical protein